MNNEIKNISTVSQYFAKGGFEIGFLLESPVLETEKALGFSGVKYNSYGNAYNGTIWLPKSQIKEVENDYYTHPDAPGKMYLCPAWLYRKNPTLGEKAA